MSTMTITVRDAARSLHSRVHASRADYLVAALSDDPESIDELAAVLRRFLPADEASRFFKGWSAGDEAEPFDAGVCLIDLAARLVVVRSTYSLPSLQGSVEVLNREGREDMVRYHLDEDWLFRTEPDGWEAVARERRRARAVAQYLDARPVLYGSVCEFIAQACAGVATSGTMVADDSERYLAISDIHARWLSTNREDLRGRAPRDLLLEKRSHLSWQIQDRGEYWSCTGHAPPPIAKESIAYRFGGFGTHEVVQYYYLVRYLLTTCWDRLVTNREPIEELDSEVRRLEAARDEWLNTPDYMDLHGRTPASVIERERLRLPEAMTGAEAVIDHDCPMCQMMADLPGPMFWHLDGCNMDAGFAFSFHRTREEWEKEEREFEAMSRRIGENRGQERRESDSPWRASSSTEMANEPPVLAMLRFAAHLAELTQNLKDVAADPFLTDDLNRSFGNLREVLDPPNLDMIEPVLERLCESLATIADTHPALMDKVVDLDRQIRAFGRRLSGPPVEDVPF